MRRKELLGAVAFMAIALAFVYDPPPEPPTRLADEHDASAIDERQEPGA